MAGRGQRYPLSVPVTYIHLPVSHEATCRDLVTVINYCTDYRIIYIYVLTGTTGTGRAITLTVSYFLHSYYYYYPGTVCYSNTNTNTNTHRIHAMSILYTVHIIYIYYMIPGTIL